MQSPHKHGRGFAFTPTGSPWKACAPSDVGSAATDRMLESSSSSRPNTSPLCCGRVLTRTRADRGVPARAPSARGPALPRTSPCRALRLLERDVQAKRSFNIGGDGPQLFDLATSEGESEVAGVEELVRRLAEQLQSAERKYEFDFQAIVATEIPKQISAALLRYEFDFHAIIEKEIPQQIGDALSRYEIHVKNMIGTEILKQIVAAPTSYEFDSKGMIEQELQEMDAAFARYEFNLKDMIEEEIPKQIDAALARYDFHSKGMIQNEIPKQIDAALAKRDFELKDMIEEVIPKQINAALARYEPDLKDMPVENVPEELDHALVVAPGEMASTQETAPAREREIADCINSFSKEGDTCCMQHRYDCCMDTCIDIGDFECRHLTVLKEMQELEDAFPSLNLDRRALLTEINSLKTPGEMSGTRETFLEIERDINDCIDSFSKEGGTRCMHDRFDCSMDTCIDIGDFECRHLAILKEMQELGDTFPSLNLDRPALLTEINSLVTTVGRRSSLSSFGSTSA